MVLVAFYRKDFSNLFIMMLTQMACKQTSYNVLELIMPIIKGKSKLNKLKKMFKESIDLFTVSSVTKKQN
jgi:hypothetical protein